MTGFNTQLSAECISLLNLVMALSSLVQFIISVLRDLSYQKSRKVILARRMSVIHNIQRFCREKTKTNTSVWFIYRCYSSPSAVTSADATYDFSELTRSRDRTRLKSCKPVQTSLRGSLNQFKRKTWPNG